MYGARPNGGARRRGLLFDAAVAEGLLDPDPVEQVLLPRPARERRYLTRVELMKPS